MKDIREFKMAFTDWQEQEEKKTNKKGGSIHELFPKQIQKINEDFVKKLKTSNSFALAKKEVIDAMNRKLTEKQNSKLLWLQNAGLVPTPDSIDEYAKAGDPAVFDFTESSETSRFLWSSAADVVYPEPITDMHIKAEISKKSGTPQLRVWWKDKDGNQIGDCTSFRFRNTLSNFSISFM